MGGRSPTAPCGGGGGCEVRCVDQLSEGCGPNLAFVLTSPLPPPQVVVATPRQLESLIRISEALARMRLSEEVTKADVEEAVRLWYTAMSGSAASSDGNIDMDNIFTGATTAARQAQKQLPDELRALLQGEGRGGGQYMAVQYSTYRYKYEEAAAQQAAKVSIVTSECLGGTHCSSDTPPLPHFLTLQVPAPAP